MKHKKRLDRYYANRIKLEKTLQKTWTLSILSKLLFFLVNLVENYWR